MVDDELYDKLEPGNNEYFWDDILEDLEKDHRKQVQRLKEKLSKKESQKQRLENRRKEALSQLDDAIDEYEKQLQ